MKRNNSIENYPKTLSIKWLKDILKINQNNILATSSWTNNWKNVWNIWIEINKNNTEWFLRVFFTQTDYNWIKKEFNYKIKLVSTPCNYWWIRRRFLCPCKWNRCSILYLQDNWIFASRKTLNLIYPKQRESKSKRLLDILFINFDIAEILETIKYPFRNWKPTKKMKKVLKLRKKYLLETNNFKTFLNL